MVYQFRGQVKIEDVQKAFDDMINLVNRLRKKYEDALKTTSYDVSVGGIDLAPNRYTLSVGGLKAALKDMQGATFGCRVFKCNNTYVVSSGIRIEANNTIIPIPAGVVTGGTGNYVIFNKTSKTFTFSQSRTENGTITTISKVNKNEDNGLCDVEDALNDAPSNVYYCGNNATGYYDTQILDTSKENFVTLAHAAEHGDDVSIRFKGTTIGRAYRPGKNNSKYAVYWQHFFLPRGVASPFSSNSSLVVQKVFQALKPGEQETTTTGQTTTTGLCTSCLFYQTKQTASEGTYCLFRAYQLSPNGLTEWARTNSICVPPRTECQFYQKQ